MQLPILSFPHDVEQEARSLCQMIISMPRSRPQSRRPDQENERDDEKQEHEDNGKDNKRLGRTELFVQAAGACSRQGQETHWQAQGCGLEGREQPRIICCASRLPFPPPVAGQFPTAIVV